MKILHLKKIQKVEQFECWYFTPLLLFILSVSKQLLSSFCVRGRSSFYPQFTLPLQFYTIICTVLFTHFFPQVTLSHLLLRNIL